MERAVVRCSGVLCSEVPAYPMGKATNSTLPQYFLTAAMKLEYFSAFYVRSLSQPRSLQDPTFIRIRVHSFLLTLF